SLAQVMRRLDGAITHERELQVALLNQSEQNFEQIFNQHPLPLWVHDPETGQVLAVNEAAIAMYGYSRDEFLTMHVGDITGGAPVTDSPAHRTSSGELVDVQCDIGPVTFRHGDALLVLTRDVTEQRRLQQRLEHNAMHDPLTGLANRVLLRERIHEAQERARIGDGYGFAVLVLDLDGFKMVNDTLGHSTGDRVLAITSARIARCIKRIDTPARLGGDEFGILLDLVKSEEDALRVAERIIGEIRRPINLHGRRINVSGCCGVAFVSDAGRLSEDLISDADMAMYAAKAQGPGITALFVPALRTALLNRIGMEQALTSALRNRELVVAYQPQLELRSGRVVAVEALVRWRHPDRGFIPPDEFVPLAEELGIIAAIDEWVLRTALQSLRRWSDAGHTTLRIGVNLSGQDLGRDDLAAAVRGALSDAGLDPWRLELELTETTAVAHPAVASRRLHELRGMGVRIAVDDFGTGFSMLSSLRDLPIDRLKIDRSFVKGLDRDDDARAIVGSTITMGHALGLDLCAEGVETLATAELLSAIGCDSGQGYLFARPMSERDLLRWLERFSMGGLQATAPTTLSIPMSVPGHPRPGEARSPRSARRPA
ncbi:MAG: EAL domain-containing protein, partial [Candidatus Dormibacteraeota bacterium]|nr:EAL domain-containing protein [Candidatus Dormibacteraeota bacterium]